MKKIFLVILPLLILSVMVGCSKNTDAKVGPTVTEETKPYLEKYDKQVQNFITQSNDLLTNFSTALDGVYTKEYSASQFATELKQFISNSSELVKEIESTNVDPSIFETHQQLILLANNQHQLFLDAIAMANDNDVDKETLRQQFLQIKSDQADFVNTWKSTMKELKNENTQE